METETPGLDYSHRFYKESGKAPVGGILIMLLAGCGAALVLGSIYSVLTFYNPFIYINFLATVFLGFLVGRAVAQGSIVGRVRNTAARLGIALLVAIFVEYVSWAVFLAALVEWNGVILDPWAMFSVAQLVAENGYFSVGGGKVSGIILWVLWTVEALIVVGATVIFSSDIDRVFCETSGDWAKTEKNVVRLMPDRDDFVQGLLDERYEVLNDGVRVLSDTAVPALRVDLRQSRIRTANHFVSLTALSQKQGKDQVETEETNILENLIVPVEVTEKLRALRLSRSPA